MSKQSKNRVDPLRNFRFLISIENITIAGFSEASGLEQSIETEDYKEGGNGFIHKLPIGIKYSNLILKRGLSDTQELWQWYQQIITAIQYKKPLMQHKKNINLLILDIDGKKTEWLFKFSKAYPIKWTGASFDAKGNGIAIETLEFVHEGFEVIKR
jgi:phage tail-like protein